MRKKSGQTRFTPKIGKPTLGIVTINRKTEICRNWQRGCCVYGDYLTPLGPSPSTISRTITGGEAAKCAFAHGAHELKHQSLDEMEYTGRIPNASKFRCYPCLTWVATGSCPYFARCVFIHDPRIRGPTDAYLYSVNDHKSGSGKGGGVGSPFGRDTFYWPDMPRTDGDGKSLPSISVNYDMDSRMLESDNPTDRAVYHLWYSLVRTLVEIFEEAQRLARSMAGPQPLERPPFSTVRAEHTAPQLSRPPCSGSWSTKKEERRLPLFVRLSKGESVAPSYVPVPDTAGPRRIWSDDCEVCERAARVEHQLIAPRSRRVRSSTNLRSAFPLGDINPDHGRREVYAEGKPTRQEEAWRSHDMREENERPPRVPLANRCESLPRRSTAPPALGRVTGTTRRVFGSEVVRGLFGGGRQGNLQRKPNAPFVKTERKPNYAQALGRSFGSDGDDTSNSRVRRNSTEETSLMSMTSPSFLVCDTESANIPRPSPTSSTSWPSSATPLTASPGMDDDVTLGFSTAYPFGAFADGMR